MYDVTNEHPFALQVSVSLALKNGDDPCGQAVDKGKPPSRISHWFLCPEFKAPTLAPTAVAADAGGEPNEPEWIYSRDQSESLHPFWAVRRLTDTELQKEKDEVRDKMKKTGASLRMPEFNCELVSHTPRFVTLRVSMDRICPAQDSSLSHASPTSARWKRAKS